MRPVFFTNRTLLDIVIRDEFEGFEKNAQNVRRVLKSQPGPLLSLVDLALSVLPDFGFFAVASFCCHLVSL